MQKYLAGNGKGYTFATAFEKESTPDDGEGDKEERSLRKLIETAKRYKGKGVTVIVTIINSDDKSKGKGSLSEETKTKLFIQRRV